MQGTIYDKTTGKIIKTITATSKGSFLRNINGENYVEGIFDSSVFYILNEKAVPRPKMDINVKGTTLINLHDNCTIFINKEIFSVIGNEWEYKTDSTGEYPVVIESFPYIPWKGILKVKTNKKKEVTEV